MTKAPPSTEKDAAVAVEATGIGKRFTVGRRQMTALEGVTLSIRTGAVSALIGPDGAGKTTLLRLIAGLLAPDRGAISVFGLDPVAQPDAVHAITGYMPQRFGLYEDLTVQENLDLYADLHGVPSCLRAGRFHELLEMTKLVSFRDRLAGKLSGGMKQKLGLACTLVARPRLLLLDEPTVGVDPVSRRELWVIIEAMVESGATVLMSTAYLDEAERCREIFMLHAGQLMRHGAPDAELALLAGRCYEIRGAGNLTRRLQSRLEERPEMIDTVIQGDAVRVVTVRPQAPKLDDLAAEFPALTVTPVQPRFEDGFITRLKPLVEPVALGRAISASSKPLGREGSVIEVQEVERWFGAFQAVKRISFEVKRGEVFGLLGANGAGKTTTFRMLCGLLPPSRGQLRVAGVDLRSAASEARRRIGYMSQKFSLYGALSVRQNLEFFASAYRLDKGKRRVRLDWALKEFQLTAYAESASGDLPLGHKQRLALACALLHEPEILFLDEPTSGVDPLMRRAFWSAINVLAEQGVTVLVTTHFMEEAEYCDRLVIMAAGSLLAAGRPQEIRAKALRPERPNPTLEDAFILLLEQSESSHP
ncbi:ATP-binding cassette domain-containing protein [Methylococcus geothermalis]|uniref:ATP-binding cassette domain-containing protein n=1 Tax=Methylococcus geothermalis TaxID=2681310 RepID=A0A858Q9G8_9GAMM|nr:ATP-binding cassette domain-containing protein [Methylococcus geothermalis]QJD30415.1 ATP-binding cassette domain-containing protein [Methylococcus geothermalis]